jgi:hypothetical protein
MLGIDPWHHHRTLRRATIIGVSAFFLITAPIALKRIDMSLRGLQILFFGWMIFILTNDDTNLPGQVSSMRPKFYVKGTVLANGDQVPSLWAGEVRGCGCANESRRDRSMSIMDFTSTDFSSVSQLVRSH